MDKKTQIQNLIKSQKLSTAEECSMFDSALCALWNNVEVDDIDDLLKAFSDDTEQDEIMFSLLHIVESLDSDDSLQKIALLTPEMQGAEEWAKLLNRRILNSEQHCAKYRKLISALPAYRQEKILALLAKLD